MKKLYEKELIKLIKEKAKLPYNLSSKTIDVVLQIMKTVIAEEVKSGRIVYLKAFGRFESYIRYPRKGINPSNLKIMNVKESVVPKFRSAMSLRDFLNDKNVWTKK